MVKWAVCLTCLLLAFNGAESLTCREVNSTSSAFTSPSDIKTMNSVTNTFTVCYSWALRIQLTIPGGPQGTGSTSSSENVIDMGGFPYPSTADSTVTQNLYLTNISTVAQCQQYLTSYLAFSKTTSNLYPQCSNTSGYSCQASFTCCDSTSNCNAPLSLLASTRAAPLLLSLVAAVLLSILILS